MGNDRLASLVPGPNNAWMAPERRLQTAPICKAKTAPIRRAKTTARYFASTASAPDKSPASCPNGRPEFPECWSERPSRMLQKLGRTDSCIPRISIRMAVPRSSNAGQNSCPKCTLRAPEPTHPIAKVKKGRSVVSPTPIHLFTTATPFSNCGNPVNNLKKYSWQIGS